MHKIRYMPARPKVDAHDEQILQELGERLRLARKRKGLSADKIAQAAGITRVTLHRLEVGEPAAATLGTLAKVLGVLGMSADLMLLAREDRRGHRLRDAQRLGPKRPALPPLISLKDLPHLRDAGAWHIRDEEAQLTPEEVYALYERNWRHLDPEKIKGKEARLLKQLTHTVGKGVLLV